MPTNDVLELSVIVPVYNEPDWIPVSIGDLDKELEESPFAGRAEIIVVDDGSAPPTGEALRRMATCTPLRTITQPRNMGRWEARKRGIAEARGRLLLFIDSRVSLAPGSLAFVYEQTRDAAFQVWNGHVDMDDAENPYSRFWRILVEESWPDFWRGDGRIRFGPDDYDRHPRGFGCFLAPAEDIRWAYEHAPPSFYDDPRLANDETVLRTLVERHHFNLDPAFRISYRGRRSLRAFVRHAHFRGVFFVDGFLRPGTRFFVPLIAAVPASLALGGWALRRPRRVLGLVMAVPVTTAALAISRGRSARDVRVLSALSLPWAVAFASGIWRGLAYAVRIALRGRR